MIVEVTELGQWFLNCGPRLPGDRESHLGLTVALFKNKILYFYGKL